ncbi:hypothetical protein BVI434_1830017 [Burkholderia vietnamiensis]|nr:hypothetical protein BVI434_1830017 [Burkholderia vietnamiensis]
MRHEKNKKCCGMCGNIYSRKQKRHQDRKGIRMDKYRYPIWMRCF